MANLKIGVPISDSYNPKAGGAFSYTQCLIKEIDIYEFDPQLEIVFINLTGKTLTTDFHKEFIAINAYETYTIKDLIRKIGIVLFKSIGFSYFVDRLESIHASIRRRNIKKKLEENGVKILFYTSPANENYDSPFITTHWDNGHLSTYNFPEFLNENDLNWRHKYYDKILPKAFGILTETQTGKNELINYTAINEARIAVMPIFPSDVINLELPSVDQERIISQLQIERNKFIFYPAQFWAHKNHTLLIDAFEMLLEKHKEFKLILTGSDKGNMNYIINYIEKKKLSDKVMLLGFVENNIIYTLYKNALCLVMPSFLGPSNMPPLEAAHLNCPVILSNLIGHQELLGEYGIYFDPCSVHDLYRKIEDLIENGQTIPFFRNKEIFNVQNSVRSFEKYLLSVMPIRNTWQ